MLKILFVILFISLIIKIFYINIEKFSVSIQNSSNSSNSTLQDHQELAYTSKDLPPRVSMTESCFRNTYGNMC